ncbi:MAG: DNA polymerase III subunit alpha [Thermodesulfobacteriota bacterium]
MEHSKFVHLHLHTKYSLLDGAIRHEDLFKLAKEYKMPAVAMTDHGNMFGAVEFYINAIKYGIKPIIGCEIYVAPGSRFEKTPISKGGATVSSYHLILLVKNIKGYRNLCRLVTSGYLEGFYYKPRIDKELLRQYNEGLIALSACMHGEIANLLNIGEKKKAVETASEYKDIFQERRFFLELQDNGVEGQREINKGLLEISRKLDIPVIATNDCHYLRREEAKAHDVLVCIQTGKTVNDKDRLKFSTDEFYMKSPQEMEKLFKEIPEAITNTIEVAERCNLEMELGTPQLPEFLPPNGEDIDTYFESQARGGLEKRLEKIAPKDTDKWHYMERLEKELKVIKKMGFSGYFLIVADLISQARRKGIPVGPGRGSAAGSLVAYSLGITNIDPIRDNLMFERFLNPDRISLPDIDIDFCYEGREDVIKYVSEKYGKDNVTQIITFGQMKAKAVIRDVGRALDMPYGEVDKIAKMIPQVQKITIEESIRQEPGLKDLINKDNRIKELIEVAKSLEGLTRHASTHAAGIVISNRPLVEYLPLYKGQKDEVVTTQYAMKDVERIGLVKFDFLGLKTLTVIDKTVKLIKMTKGIDLDIDDIPFDDIETYKMIGKSNTNGVFQLESSGIKDLLRKLKPKTFDDLMAAVALYRPGPLQSGMVDDFIKRKHGKISIKYELPVLKEILQNTYGVIVYQEQVMEIAKVLASYTPGDADILRKAMGKKLPEEMLEQRERFLTGAKKNRIPEKVAEKMFDIMAKFAGYGFNKSHSAAYALIAYQTAYLKAHHPIEFMTALLTSDMGDTNKVIKYIGECRDMGIEVLPPDVNESDRDFSIVENKIRFGLAAVKNVGSMAIEEILDSRKKGKFDSFIEFLGRIDSRKVNKKVIESLIKCGAFDLTGAKRSQLLSCMDKAIEIAQGIQRDRQQGQITIFDTMSDVKGIPTLKLPDIEEWPEKEKLLHEKETLGFYITGHPLLRHSTDIKLYSTVDTDTIKGRLNDDEVSICGIVASLKEIKTKKGEKMAFINLEDLKGNIEIIVFSALYSKANDCLKSTTPLIVTGRVDKGEEHTKIIASDIYPLEKAKERFQKKVHIVVNAKAVGSNSLNELKKIIMSHLGTSPVFLHLREADGEETVIALPDNMKITPSDGLLSSLKCFSPEIEVRLL